MLMKKLNKILELFFDGKNIYEIASALGITVSDIKKELQKITTDSSKKTYIAYIDGAAKGNPGPAGAGVIVITPEGKEFRLGKELGIKTNNEAEYNALILALSYLKEIRAKHVLVRSDSNLLVNQLNGNYKVKKPELRLLFLKAIELMRAFDQIEFEHISRNENKRADIIANDYIKLDKN